MKKRKIVLIGVIALAFAAVCVLTFVIMSRRSEGLHTAVIKKDGEIIRTIDLDTAPDEEFSADDDNGYNVICVKNGEIYVSEASCPDKVCVGHGPLRSEFLPIICIPNRLVIELK